MPDNQEDRQEEVVERLEKAAESAEKSAEKLSRVSKKAEEVFGEQQRKSSRDYVSLAGDDDIPPGDPDDD